jgi:hypothetical protein
MTTTCTACPNTACERGAVTTMVGKVIGRASNGCEVRSETFMVPSNEMCPACRGRGRIMVEIDAEPVETPATAEVITYLGEAVDAPGFTQDQFERAMLRAFCDDLQITSYHDGRHLVGYQGLYGYVVTRTSCDCKARRVGTPCKHRAFLIAHLDVHQPHIRREWAKLNQQRPARKAVAS